MEHTKKQTHTDYTATDTNRSTRDLISSLENKQTQVRIRVSLHPQSTCGQYDMNQLPTKHNMALIGPRGQMVHDKCQSLSWSSTVTPTTAEWNGVTCKCWGTMDELNSSEIWGQAFFYVSCMSKERQQLLPWEYYLLLLDVVPATGQTFTVTSKGEFSSHHKPKDGVGSTTARPPPRCTWPTILLSLTWRRTGLFGCGTYEFKT